MVNFSSGYRSGRTFILSGVAVFVLAACQVKDIALTELKQNYILAAEGGGFAGLEHRYLLSGNGKIYYQVAGNDTLQYLGSLERDQTTQLFQNAEAVMEDPKSGSGPGNRYFILEFRRETGTMRKVWDPDLVTVPERWRLLHQTIVLFGRKFKEKRSS